MGEASKKVPLGILRSPVLQPGPLPDFEGPGRVRAESFGSSGASSPPEQVLPGSRTNWKTVKTTIFVRNQIFALKGVIGFRNLLLASSFFLVDFEVGEGFCLLRSLGVKSAGFRCPHKSQ